MIRRATEADLPRLTAIYASAREYMRTHGNPDQWRDGYPREALLRRDIAQGTLYAMAREDGSLFGAFVLVGGEDPTYRVIEGGSWASGVPYGTIHRIAGDGSERGVFRRAVEFARTRYDHLRVDTHEANLTMQRAILREGFVYRGIIYQPDGSPRYAYDWTAWNSI